MRPTVQYNDRLGHASADIMGVDYEEIARRCNLGQRYTIIGISLYGTDNISVALLCKDNQESTPENEVLVRVYPSIDLQVATVIERLNVTINITHNPRYDDPELEVDREVNIELEEEEN